MPRSADRHANPGAALRSSLLFAIVLLSTGSPGSAQRSVAASQLLPLPTGVTLPVQVTRTLRAGKVRAGTKIVAKTTQRVPVREHVYLKRGAELQGEVVTSVAGDGTVGRPAILTLQFTLLRYQKQTVPVTTKAIAIANFTDVDDTSLPATGGSDRGNASEASWTTRQVGGDEVYRSGWVGDVCDSKMRKVGYADYYGVYSLPTKPPIGDGPALPRAMGVFSTTAAGLYGFDEGAALHSAGGAITLTRVGKKLLMRNGDNLLLEVLASHLEEKETDCSGTSGKTLLPYRDDSGPNEFRLRQDESRSITNTSAPFSRAGHWSGTWWINAAWSPRILCATLGFDVRFGWFPCGTRLLTTKGAVRAHETTYVDPGHNT